MLNVYKIRKLKNSNLKKDIFMNIGVKQLILTYFVNKMLDSGKLVNLV